MIFEVGNDMNFKKTFAIYEKESNRTAIVTLLLIAPFFRGIKKLALHCDTLTASFNKKNPPELNISVLSTREFFYCHREKAFIIQLLLKHQLICQNLESTRPHHE